MQEAQFGNNVKLQFTARLEDGTIFDNSTIGEPLEITIGGGDVVVGLEEAIVGMKLGEKKTVEVEPDRAFGPNDPKLVFTVNRAEFPENFPFKEGQRLSVPTDDGNQLEATVANFTDDEVTLDCNHPYSTKTVIFDIELVDIT